MFIFEIKSKLSDKKKGFFPGFIYNAINNLINFLILKFLSFRNHVDNSFIDQSSYQGKYLEIHPYYRNHLGDPLNPFQTNNHGAVSKIGNNYIYAGKI